AVVGQVDVLLVNHDADPAVAVHAQEAGAERVLADDVAIVGPRLHPGGVVDVVADRQVAPGERVHAGDLGGLPGGAIGDGHRRGVGHLGVVVGGLGLDGDLGAVLELEGGVPVEVEGALAVDVHVRVAPDAVVLAGR